MMCPICNCESYAGHACVTTVAVPPMEKYATPIQTYPWCEVCHYAHPAHPAPSPSAAHAGGIHAALLSDLQSARDHARAHGHDTIALGDLFVERIVSALLFDQAERDAILEWATSGAAACGWCKQRLDDHGGPATQEHLRACEKNPHNALRSAFPSPGAVEAAAVEYLVAEKANALAESRHKPTMAASMRLMDAYDALVRVLAPWCGDDKCAEYMAGPHYHYDDAGNEYAARRGAAGGQDG